MRLSLLVALTCITTPVTAWEFTPGKPCVLSHQTDIAAIELTYDPTGPLYTLTVTRAEQWPKAPVFAMRFDGPKGRSIGTSRHQRNNSGRSLSVTDTGFSNVLDGLEFNQTATALSGDATVTFPLEGATGPVRAFRACVVDIPLS